MPKFVDFRIVEEKRGRYLLGDGTYLFCLLTVNDIAVIDETVYGPNLNVNFTVKFWVRSPDELRRKMIGKPLAPVVVPLKQEEGWELVDVEGVIQQASVVCEFDDYRLALSLKIHGVARNMRYRDGTFNPLYNIAWEIKQNIEKRESKEVK
ncbi:MAG: hypothetical protein ACP6IP_05840 [Candidatus Njordarchaeia archaeon]